MIRKHYILKELITIYNIIVNLILSQTESSRGYKITDFQVSFNSDKHLPFYLVKVIDKNDNEFLIQSNKLSDFFDYLKKKGFDILGQRVIYNDSE